MPTGSPVIPQVSDSLGSPRPPTVPDSGNQLTEADEPCRDAYEGKGEWEPVPVDDQVIIDQS